MSSNNITDALYESFVDTEPREPVNVPRALMEVAEALHALGTNHAEGGVMGGLELLAKEVRDGSERIADALNNLADAVREARRT